MTIGEHEAITVRPLGVAGIVPQMFCPEPIADRRHAHGHPRVARLRLLDCVHRKTADGVDAQLIELSQAWMAYEPAVFGN